eukprot:9354199-Lingulodinium_polyedra.AAC.1
MVTSVINTPNAATRAARGQLQQTDEPGDAHAPLLLGLSFPRAVDESKAGLLIAADVVLGAEGATTPP